MDNDANIAEVLVLSVKTVRNVVSSIFRKLGVTTRAQAVAAAIFLARTGASKAKIRDYIQANDYDLDFTLEQIRPTYRFDVTCDGSVPQAIVAFLEADSFEDAIRNAISLGGDGDTQACIAGAIAEAFYGIPESIREQVFDYMDETLQDHYMSYAEILY